MQPRFRDRREAREQDLHARADVDTGARALLRRIVDRDAAADEGLRRGLLKTIDDGRSEREDVRVVAGVARLEREALKERLATQRVRLGARGRPPAARSTTPPNAYPAA